MAGKEKKGGKEGEFSQLSLDELAQTKKDVENFLEMLEDQYRKASVSEASYKEGKEKNQKKLAEVVKLLQEWGYSEPPKTGAAATPAPAAEIPPSAAQPRPPTQQAAAPTQQQVSAAFESLQKELMESRLKIETERLKALIDALKEGRQATDERIQRITENIGEIRSLVFQREGAASQQEMKLKKMEELVNEIKPQEIAKEFSKRDKTLAQDDVRLEKIEKKLDEVSRTAAGTQALIKSIGGLENVASINTEMARKTQMVSDTAKRIDRLSDKIEKIFIDLNKNLEEFLLYKTKQDTMDELVKDMLKSVDSLTIKLEGYVQKEDLNLMKTDIAGLSGKLEEVGKLIDMIIPVVRLKLPDTIQSLKKDRDDIETLLASLEKAYKGKSLSRKEYLKARETNLQKLADIEEHLKKEWQKIGWQDVQQDAAAQKEAARPGQKEGEKKDVTVAGQKTDGGKDQPPQQPEKAGPAGNKQAEAVPAKPATPKQETPAGQKPRESQPPEKKQTRKEKLLSDLKDSLDKGLISKEAYEKTRQMLENS
ncbi:MAG: hypothetical protein HY518_01050 [Candidatus Aenigmarchaeota archaeon]|nr:hypothetical protein [Candidatus Aenigmarchaeota archaeon]